MKIIVCFVDSELTIKGSELNRLDRIVRSVNPEIDEAIPNTRIPFSKISRKVHRRLLGGDYENKTYVRNAIENFKKDICREHCQK